MKTKTYKLAVALLLLSVMPIMFGGCGGKTGTPLQDTAPPPELTASITSAEGWTEDEFYLNFYHSADGKAAIRLGSVILPSGIKTEKAYAEYLQKADEILFENARSGPISPTVIGGLDAVQYEMTTAEGTHFLQFFILKNARIYSITCYALEADFNGFAKDFQRMVDSYTLK